MSTFPATVSEAFDYDDLQAWLEPQIEAVAPPAGRPPYTTTGPDGISWVSPGLSLTSPGRAILVVLYGGPGLVLTEERTHDALAVQFEVRGTQNDPGDSKALAWLIDHLIVDAVTPVSINGHHCIATDRVGPPPTFHGIDDPSSMRSMYRCSYHLTIARWT